MDRAKLLAWIQSLAHDLRLSARRCVDQVERTARSQETLAGPFLSPEEQNAAVSVAGFFDCPAYALWPPDAERKLFLTAPVGADPLEAIDATTLRMEPITDQTHRDVLGSLMASGITRESIGDIRFGDGFAECMVKESVAGYLRDQVQRIGRAAVRLHVLPTKGFTVEEKAPEPRTIIVASVRLDAVVAAVVPCSREQANQRIRRGEVKRNHAVCHPSGTALDMGDVLSIRGIGRVRLLSIEKTTKKGNTVLRIEQSR